jgi:hypothetical protein
MPRSPCSWDKVTFEALVKRWAGILISDGYRVYQPWVHGRQSWLTHLIRREQGLGDRWVEQILSLWRPADSAASSRLPSW